MQDPNADTEWNDALRRHGILPEKEKSKDEQEMTEEDFIAMVEQSIAEKASGKKDLSKATLDELDELEDDEDEAVILAYRNQRINELRAAASRAKFGDLLHIGSHEFVDQVNKAGKDVWVVLHLYKDSVQQCVLVNNHLRTLAKKFPQTKFVKSISTDCIKNYPDANLPTFLVYRNGDMVKQVVGITPFGGNTTTPNDLEWAFKQIGAVESQLVENPRAKHAVKDVLTSKIRGGGGYGSDDDE
ncbi:phosducin-like protein 3 [Capsaspora owczarzaki ATCC 30864]|uniref:Phosducin-like protein 3 n=1 Tax=Capsaspora owczarzaki (strain ATCC 30864) TaxID=595528 RepID=A0A0D2WIS2_CAPO3|nr:phosducin-like protein 3 [Capsaspora owczarzaki ATCC 30864]KJE89795.1 phosducin-like protein 3 [Capsaspora owczarzaki ATCC 30864]|eukprot:XP_004349716.1 phosducin-like protein 3 [Capsaspora owczarzaki ATCC 30864]